MAKRYFNWKLAIVLVIGVVVLGTTAFVLRRWQKSSRVEQRLILGIKAYNEQKWDEAAKNLGSYLRIKPNDVSAFLKYADAQINRRPLKFGNYKQAEVAYRSVLRIDKNNSEAAMRVCELYLTLAKSPEGQSYFGEAELIARRYLETNQDPELRRMLAVALAGQRKFNEAAAELKSIIAEYPDQILAYGTLGQFIEQRPEDFLGSPGHWFDEAVKNNPSTALAYIIRAGFHLRNKDRPKALADLEQAEKLDLSEPLTRLRLADGFITADVLDKAEKYLTIVQKDTPANQTLWRTWAQFALKKSLSQTKMQQIAESGLKELSSQPWDFLPLAAELFISCGDFENASDCLDRLKQKDVAPDAVAFLEGLIADREGRLFEAIKCWRRAIELGNKSSQVRLALASTLFRLGDTQSALQQLRTLVSKRPNFFDGRLALARLLAQNRIWAEATEHARRAMQLSPENLNAVLLHLHARIQLLAAYPTGGNAQIWQGIEKQLSALEKATNGAVEVKLLQFQLAMQQGNLDDAATTITQLKKTELSKVKIALAETELLVAQDKTNDAILILNETIEEFPEAVEPVRYLAILLNRQGNHKKSEAIIKDALARIEQPVAQRELGLLLAELYSWWEQQDNAYEFLNTLAEKLPNDIPVKRQLLSSEPLVKDVKKAQQLVNDIKSLEGEGGWQWRYEQAKIWSRAGNFEAHYPRIIPLLQENLLANPNDQDSRMLLAAAYERAGELQLAISAYRDALSRSPDNLRIISPTVFALYKAKEYDQADEILNRASQKKLYPPQLQRLHWQSHLERGQLGPASDILQDSLNNDPNNQEACFYLALVKMQQSKFAEAGELLAKLKTQDPNSLPITYAQIQLNIHQDRPEEALRFCNEIVNSLNNASAYIIRARTYAALEQINKAVEDFEHATAIEPNNVEAWITRSRFYRSIGQPDKAVADIQQALLLVPDNIQIQKLAISLFLADGNPDRTREGRTILNEALESNPEDIELQLINAHLLLEKGTAQAIETAEQVLQKISEDQPDSGEAWVMLGKISLRQGQPGKAIDDALRGLVHRPNDKALLLLKAQAEAARSPTLAIPTLYGLHELDPNDVDIAIHLAKTYITAGEPEKAVNLVRKLLGICDASNRRRCNIALAVALYKNGNKEEAKKQFDFLIESAPDDPEVLFAQARLLKDDQLWGQLNQKVTDWYRKHPEDTRTPITIAGDLAATENSQARQTAEALLRRILERDPNSLPAMNMLAMLLHVTEHVVEAAELYEQILELEPNSVVALNNLAWIMCENQGKYQRALELAQRGLKIAPQYIDLIDTRGVTYYHLREFDKAVQDFTECIKLYPSSTPAAATSHLHLAKAYNKLGKTHMATEHLDEALDLESRIGGLSTTDLAEARHLLEQLQGGS